MHVYVGIGETHNLVVLIRSVVFLELHAHFYHSYNFHKSLEISIWILVNDALQNRDSFLDEILLVLLKLILEQQLYDYRHQF